VATKRANRLDRKEGNPTGGQDISTGAIYRRAIIIPGVMATVG